MGIDSSLLETYGSIEDKLPLLSKRAPKEPFVKRADILFPIIM